MSMLAEADNAALANSANGLPDQATGASSHGQIAWLLQTLEADTEPIQLPEDCIALYQSYSRSELDGTFARPSLDLERNDPQTCSRVDEVAEQSHSGGFSADQFASYEKRLKSSASRVDAPRAVPSLELSDIPELHR